MSAMKRPPIHHALPSAYLIVLLACLTSTQAQAKQPCYDRFPNPFTDVC